MDIYKDIVTSATEKEAARKIKKYTGYIRRWADVAALAGDIFAIELKPDDCQDDTMDKAYLENIVHRVSERLMIRWRSSRMYHLKKRVAREALLKILNNEYGINASDCLLATDLSKDISNALMFAKYNRSSNMWEISD